MHVRSVTACSAKFCAKPHVRRLWNYRPKTGITKNNRRFTHYQNEILSRFGEASDRPQTLCARPAAGSRQSLCNKYCRPQLLHYFLYTVHTVWGTTHNQMSIIMMMMLWAVTLRANSWCTLSRLRAWTDPTRATNTDWTTVLVWLSKASGQGSAERKVFILWRIRCQKQCFGRIRAWHPNPHWQGGAIPQREVGTNAATQEKKMTKIM